MWRNSEKHSIYIVFLLFFGVVHSIHNETRCFQFTWLGPRYNEDSVFLNATCNDATQLADGVPCELPLVVSRDGTWPDIEYIWANHFEETTCVLAANDICAKYTYYFNGHPENSTYMCTRAVDAQESAITNGCYTQTSGSYQTRVCFCRSVPGGVPCNHAIKLTTTLFGINLIVFIVLYLYLF
ncbi:uncharacterized protein LOC126970482 [Leptidea sinapis]|uniref:uncharacterized protein LOC126970482 n=1 Tax=Leptidea sinapis TaxID=189913 RepID=UPI002145CFAD|nr:uncharacterized protein LOC126970482 [Leptidea sinapis]